MKPSSAMALVSSFVKATADESAGVMSAARAVVSAALPVKMVTAMAPANAVLTNVRLIVLIVPFADCHDPLPLRRQTRLRPSVG